MVVLHIHKNVTLGFEKRGSGLSDTGMHWNQSSVFIFNLTKENTRSRTGSKKSVVKATIYLPGTKTAPVMVTACSERDLAHSPER